MIKRIIHIADVHIRTNKYHDLYKNQFQRLISDVSNQLIGFHHDDIRVVITGDLFHQKISISNELILLAADFLNELSDLGKVIIIPGNHDFLENNTDRVDSITPVVNLIRNSDIYYLKDSGTYQDDDVNWVIYSLYQNNQRPEFKKEEGYFNVGLFHGPIQGMSTDLGFTFDDGYDRLNFVDLDLLLCGDIHKRQAFKLPGGGYAVMVGSMIQQDFGESVKHHGYGMFNMETKEYTFHDIPNDQPFLHFSIDDIKDIETESEQHLNP